MGNIKTQISRHAPRTLGDLQISGSLLIYGQAFNQNFGTGRDRYVTSGEMAAAAGATSPASPAGSVQFNNAGNFGGDADLRWDSTAMTLTVSGGGLRVEAPTIFRTGADVQVSGALRAYRNDGHRVDITNAAGTRGVLLFPTNSQPFVLTGSGFTAGSWSANSQLITDRFTVNQPFEVINTDGVGSLQVSGTQARFYDGVVFGSVASAGATRISAAGDVQTSGTVVAYRPMYATNQTAAGRYVTSGELSTGGATSPALPFGSVQFNNAGSFGGDNDFRYNASTNTLTVSGVSHLIGATQIRGNAQITENLSISSDLSGSDTSRSQYFWGATGIAGVEYELYGSGIINGAVTFGSRWASEVTQFTLPVLFTAAAPLQLSGEARSYRTHAFGNSASRGGTRFSVDGDAQISGALRVYRTDGHRVDVTNAAGTRGVLLMPSNPQPFVLTGSGFVAGSWSANSQLFTDRFTVNMPLEVVNTDGTGSLQVSGTQARFYDAVVFGDAASRGGTRVSPQGDVQTSGTMVAYRPIYATSQAASARYVTSGELAATAPASPTGSVQFNNGGVFGGDVDLRWNGTTGTLTVSGVSHLVGATQIRGNAQVTENLSVSADLSGSDTSRSQYFWGATGIAGVEYELYGSGIVNGAIAFGSRWASEVMQFALPMRFTSAAPVQLSGTTVAYRPIYATNQTGAGRYVTSGEMTAGTPAGSDGDIQFNSSGAFGANANARLRWDDTATTLAVSGSVRSYGLLFQSSDATGGGMRLRSQNGNTWELGTGTARAFGADWFLAGSGMLFGADLNFGGAGAIPASKIRGNVQSSAVIQLSGVTLGYAPIYASSQTATQRYITSGELVAGAAAGVSGDVQFNSAGVFGASDRIRWGDGQELRVSGFITVENTAQMNGPVFAASRVVVGNTSSNRFQGLFAASEASALGDYALVGSGLISGPLTLTARGGGSAGEFVRFALPVVHTFASTVQLSGEVRSYRTHAFGNTGGTRFSADSELQVSGSLRLYGGAQVTGNINLNNGNIINVNSIIADDIIAPTFVATDHLASSATTLITFDNNALTAAALQISGAALAYVPLHQGAITGDTRYLTSGELRPVISTLYTSGAETFAAGYVRSNLMVSTTLASSMLWPENGIEFDVMGAMSPGNNSIGLNVMGVVVHLGGQLLLSGSLVTTSGMYAVRTEGSVYALAQNGRQVSSVKNGWWGPNATAVSGVAMQTVGPAQERSTVNHYLVISPTQNPQFEVSYMLTSGGLGVYQSFGRTVYARVTRLPTR